MVEFRGCVGVARRSSGDDGVWDAHCRADFGKHFFLEVGVCGDGGFYIQFVHLPPFGHGRELVDVERDGVHRLNLGSDAVLGLIGVEDAAVLSRLFRRGYDGVCVAAQLGEERKRGGKLGNAAMLFRTVGTEHMDHVCGGNEHGAFLGKIAVAGMAYEDAVRDWVAVLVVGDAVHHERLAATFGGRAGARPSRFGRRGLRPFHVARHAVGVDERKVELDGGAQGWILREKDERLAVAGAGDAHGAELFAETDAFRPSREVAFDARVEAVVGGSIAQARAIADGVIGEALDHAASVGVVLVLVARAHTENAARVRRSVRIGGEVVGLPPVGILRGRFGGGEVRTDGVEEAAARCDGFAAMLLFAKEIQHGHFTFPLSMYSLWNSSFVNIAAKAPRPSVEGTKSTISPSGTEPGVPAFTTRPLTGS